MGAFTPAIDSGGTAGPSEPEENQEQLPLNHQKKGQYKKRQQNLRADARAKKENLGVVNHDENGGCGQSVLDD
jgi:hypothetical protein